MRVDVSSCGVRAEYITKDPGAANVTAFLATIAQAEEEARKFPSAADDADTFQRHMQLTATKGANKLNRTSEYSAAFACAACLACPPEPMTEPTVVLNLRRCLDLVKERRSDVMKPRFRQQDMPGGPDIAVDFDDNEEDPDGGVRPAPQRGRRQAQAAPAVPVAAAGAAAPAAASSSASAPGATTPNSSFPPTTASGSAARAPTPTTPNSMSAASSCTWRSAVRAIKLELSRS